MKRRHAVLAAGILALGMIVLPATAAATTNAPIAQTGGMEATLPLLGTSLTVGVTLDASGGISGVTLNPTGALAQTSASAGLVKFSNADGSATLKVRAGGSKLAIAARTRTLAGLVGSGTWKADVFGTGTASTVAYTVGDDGTGKPTLVIGAVNAAPGVSAAVDAPKAKSGKQPASARAGVTFSHAGFVKHLRIAVSVNSKDSAASLKITLSGADRQRLQGSLADLAGARTWSAHLCDGTPVSVRYHLTATGDLVFDGATGAPATSRDWPAGKAGLAQGGKGWHHGWSMGAGGSVGQSRGTVVDGFVVRFDTTQVGFAAILVKNADGTYALVARGRSGSCGEKSTDTNHHHRHSGAGSSSGSAWGDRHNGRPQTAWNGAGRRASHRG